MENELISKKLAALSEYNVLKQNTIFLSIAILMIVITYMFGVLNKWAGFICIFVSTSAIAFVLLKNTKRMKYLETEYKLEVDIKKNSIFQE